MSTPGGGSIAETIVSEMLLDASKYEAGAARVIAADNAMIASFRAVMAAHAAMISQLNTAASGGYGGTSSGFNPNITGSFGGSTIMGGNRTLYGFPSNVFGGPGGAFNPYSGGTNYFGGGGNYGGVGGPGNRYGRRPLGSLGDDDKAGSGGGNSMAGFGAAYMVMRVMREFEHALLELDRVIVRISEDSLKQYASFNTLEKSFQGLYGSAQLANQMMTYLRDTAMTSAFHFKDLADAARGISAVGMDVGRWLPIVQGFALQKGDISGGGLQDFIGILRRIQGGNLGVALGPRGIGRYGIGRGELEAQGGTFDTAGHFTGTINQAFDVIERVFNSRIKAVADQVKQSFEVVLSNLQDSLQQAKIDFGHGLADVLTDPIKALTGALNDLRQGGVLQDLGEILGGIVTRGLPSAGDALKYDFSTGPDGKPLSPAEQKKSMMAYRNKRFGVGQTYDEAGNPTGGANVPSTTGNGVEDLLISIGAGIVEVVEYQKEFVEGAKMTYDLLKTVFTFGNPLLAKLLGDFTLHGAAAQGEAFKQEAFARSMMNWQDRAMHPEKYNSPTAPAGTGIPGVDNDAMPAVKDHLKHIRHSAERIAAHFDSKSTAFGGGDIGRMGVTPVEMSDYYKRASGSGIHGVMAGFGSALEREMHRIAREAFGSGLRQGLFRGA